MKTGSSAGHLAYHTTGVVFTLLGALTAICALAAGPRAYSGGWWSVLAGVVAGVMLAVSGVMLARPRFSLRVLMAALSALALALGVFANELHAARTKQRLLEAARQAATEGGCLIRESPKLRGKVVFVLEGKGLSVETVRAISRAALVQDVVVFDPIDQHVREALESAFGKGVPAAGGPTLTVFARGGS